MYSIDMFLLPIRIAFRAGVIRLHKRCPSGDPSLHVHVCGSIKMSLVIRIRPDRDQTWTGLKTIGYHPQDGVTSHCGSRIDQSSHHVYSVLHPSEVIAYDWG